MKTKYKRYIGEIEAECSVCKIIKPYKEFALDRRTKAGYAARCRNCKNRLDTDTERKFNSLREYHDTRIIYASRQEQLKIKCQRRRAKKAGNFIENVDVLVLGERDNWICQLCFRPVDRTLTGCISLAKSLDHVIPLSKGGEHSYANTQLAHFGCNSRKQDIMSIV